MVKLNKNEIELLVYDFDGVMTNNNVIIDQFGNESVMVNRSDGFAVSVFKKLGLSQIILSTERNDVVKRRAEKLGIPCLQGVVDKKNELLLYCSTNRINLKNVVYLGNEINDQEAMECVGWPICPFDAYKSIKNISKYVLTKSGGEGVIRELLDLINNKEY